MRYIPALPISALRAPMGGSFRAPRSNCQRLPTPMPKRNLHATFRVTEEERKRIRENASAAGLIPSRYMRARALKQAIRAPRSVVERDLLRELSRLGNNLNQLTRLANAGTLPDSASLKARLADIRKLIARLAAAVIKLNQR